MVATGSGCDEALLGKLHRALLPISCLMIGFCYLDRSNVAYMQLQLQHPRPAGLGFSDSLYGNASGLFFVGYSAFQIPSNIILVRHRVVSYPTGSVFFVFRLYRVFHCKALLWRWPPPSGQLLQSLSKLLLCESVITSVAVRA